VEGSPKALPVVICTIVEKARCVDFSLYAIKVACTAGKRKATLFLERIGSGAIHYQIKKREGSHAEDL
jgi:hypothetical protein